MILELSEAEWDAIDQALTIFRLAIADVRDGAVGPIELVLDDVETFPLKEAVIRNLYRRLEATGLIETFPEGEGWTE